jgi:adenylate cyclase
VEYLGIWLWYSQSHPELLTTHFMVPTLQRGIAFFMLGNVAGLVSMQIRERVSRSLHSMEERNRIVNVFGQHVSPMVVEKLLNQKTGDATEIRYVCMMFLDIRNFTTFSERSDPVLVIGYLSTLFASMIETINRHHGIINKFLGDGFMAVFGAPLSHGQDCQNAVAAAQEILTNVDRLVEAGTIPPTRIGIGLHAGEAITGNVGSSLRKEYTVIGDVVNVASRIEQLNKHFDSQLLISDAVWNALGVENANAEALEPLTVKGRVESIHIWKLA